MMNALVITQTRNSTANIFRTFTFFLTSVNIPSAKKIIIAEAPNTNGMRTPDASNSPTVPSKSSNDEFVSALHSELKNPPRAAIMDMLTTMFNKFTMNTIAQTLSKARLPVKLDFSSILFSPSHIWIPFYYAQFPARYLCNG